MKKTLVATLTAMMLLGMVMSLKAQTTEARPPRNSILSDRQEVLTQRALTPLPEIREENVMWKKGIIREIDFRPKINQVFYYPVNPTDDWRNLITVIYDGILDGRITAYRVENNVDDMITPLTRDDFERENTRIGDPPVIMRDGVEAANEISFRDRMVNVTRLRIKEDWYFDRQLSQFLVRIIALGPIIVDEDGLTQTCWIPYDDNTRRVLAEAFVANRQNGAERRTYDEIFIKRMFDSYIVKEENIYDRYISSYALYIDALFESERIKNEMFDFEQSLWEY